MDTIAGHARAGIPTYVIGIAGTADAQFSEVLDRMARGYVTDTEVLGYLRQHPETIGIDIDENTVLLLRGSEAEVFGDGRAAFIDAARSTDGPWLTLRAGQHASVK